MLTALSLVSALSGHCPELNHPDVSASNIFFSQDCKTAYLGQNAYSFSAYANRLILDEGLEENCSSLARAYWKVDFLFEAIGYDHEELMIVMDMLIDNPDDAYADRIIEQLSDSISRRMSQIREIMSTEVDPLNQQYGASVTLGIADKWVGMARAYKELNPDLEFKRLPADRSELYYVATDGYDVSNPRFTNGRMSATVVNDETNGVISVENFDYDFSQFDIRVDYSVPLACQIIEDEADLNNFTKFHFLANLYFFYGHGEQISTHPVVFE